jgi:hypothetical protein
MIALDDQLMAVPITAAANGQLLEAGTPVALFPSPSCPAYGRSRWPAVSPVDDDAGTDERPDHYCSQSGAQTLIPRRERSGIYGFGSKRTKAFFR